MIDPARLVKWFELGTPYRLVVRDDQGRIVVRRFFLETEEDRRALCQRLADAFIRYRDRLANSDYLLQRRG